MRTLNLKVLIFLGLLFLLSVFPATLWAGEQRPLETGYPLQITASPVASGPTASDLRGPAASGRGCSLQPNPAEPQDFLLLMVPVVIFIGIKWFREGFEVYRSQWEEDPPHPSTLPEQDQGFDVEGVGEHVQESDAEDFIPQIDEPAGVAGKSGSVA